MKRRFENEQDRAYWEAGVQGSWLTTRTGTIGASGGQVDSKMFKTVEEVAAETSRCIEEKLLSGFVEVVEPTEVAFEASSLWRLVAERADGPLPKLVEHPTDELVAWRAFGEEADLSHWAERLIFTQDCAPSTTPFTKLTTTMSRNVHGTALVCAAFSNLDFFCAWDNDDECTFLVCKTATTGDYHRVYAFEARLLELAGKSWPSISSFVWRDGATAQTPRCCPL